MVASVFSSRFNSITINDVLRDDASPGSVILKRGTWNQSNIIESANIRNCVTRYIFDDLKNHTWNKYVPYAMQFSVEHMETMRTGPCFQLDVFRRTIPADNGTIEEDETRWISNRRCSEHEAISYYSATDRLENSWELRSARNSTTYRLTPII